MVLLELLWNFDKGLISLEEAVAEAEHLSKEEEEEG